MNDQPYAHLDAGRNLACGPQRETAVLIANTFAEVTCPECLTRLRPVIAAVRGHLDTFIVRVPAPGGQPSSYLDEYGTLSRTGYPVRMSRELADHAVETYLAAGVTE